MLLGIFVLPWIVLNTEHPWLGTSSIWETPKLAQYFYKRPTLMTSYAGVMAYVKSQDCRKIGLMIGEDSWEYPWWPLLAAKDLRVESIGVSNASSALSYPLGDFKPCAIIAADVDAPPLLVVADDFYTPAVSTPADKGHMTVYLKAKWAIELKGLPINPVIFSIHKSPK